MYTVSNAYREAIQLHRSQGVRNRSYAQIYIGEFDATARGDAELSINDGGLSYSNFGNMNTDEKQGAAYVTWERDYFRLDGVQRFPPVVAQQGFVSAQLSGADGAFDTPVVLTVEFSTLHRMSGLTLLFDNTSEAYSDHFTVSTYIDDDLVEAHEVVNESPLYQGILTLGYRNRIEIAFHSTARPYQRLRLQHVLFGIGFVYGNEETIEVSLKRSTSPVSIELPSNKLNFILYNEDGIFAPDSQGSVYSFFTQDQECKLSLGYDIGHAIEWIGTGKFWLSNWDVDGISARFDSIDIFERMSATTYRRGTYGDKTPQELFDDVMSDFGYDNYDASNFELANSHIRNPLPIASHAECLQLIANYAMCTLETDEDGTVIMRRRTNPDPIYINAYSTDKFMFGSASGNLAAYTDPIREYASWEQDGFSLSGNMLFLPEDDEYVNNGIVWDVYPDSAVPSSLAKQQYSPMPYVRFEFAANVSFGSVVLDFGENFVPTYVRIRGCRYNDGTYDVVYNKLWKMDAQRKTIVDHFDRVAHLYVFIVGSDKRQRARLQRALFSWENGYEITENDIFGNPKGKKLPECRNVVLLLDNRTAEAEAEIKKVTIQAGEETWIDHGDMYQDVVATTTTAGATLDYASYAFATRVTASGVSGDVEVVLNGKKLVKGAEDRRIAGVSVGGEDVEVSNPLLSASSIKPGYLAWMTAHFARGIEWNAETLAYPELQPGDLISYKGMQASILDANITYKFSLKEQFILRKEEVG